MSQKVIFLTKNLDLISLIGYISAIESRPSKTGRDEKLLRRTGSRSFRGQQYHGLADSSLRRVVPILEEDGKMGARGQIGPRQDGLRDNQLISGYFPLADFQ